MIKRPRKEIWFDRLHKGAVLTCVAMTVYSGVYIGTFLYNYYFKVKPDLIAKHKLSQMELLEEGSSDRILLKDKAADLTIG